MTRDAGQNLPEGLLRGLVLVALGGAVVRLISLFFQAGTPCFGTPFLDELYFHQWAGEIASGTTLTDRVFFRAPLYAYLLGAIYRVIGDDPYPVALLQHLAGAAAVIPVGLVAFRLWNSRLPAMLAAGFAALYAPAIYFEGQLLDIWLQQWLLPLTLLAAFRVIRRPTGSAFFALGLIGGVGAIARPAALPFFAVLAVIHPLLTHDEDAPAPGVRLRRAVSRSLLMVLGIALPILPVTIRNYHAEGVFVPISTYTGVNLWIGNNAAADGFTASTPIRYPNFGRYEDSVELFARTRAAEVAGRELNSKEVQRYWTGLAIDEITSNPGRTARLAFKKLALIFNSYEIKNNRNYDLAVSFNPVLRTLAWVFNFGLMAPLAITGLLWAFRSRRSAEFMVHALLLATLAAGVLLFFVNVRYRFPFAYLLLPVSAAGVVRLFPTAPDRYWHARPEAGTLAGVLARTESWGVFLAAALIVNVDWYNIRATEDLSADYRTVANCCKDRGDAEGALEWYDRSLSLDRRNADSHNNRGETLHALGRTAEAREAFVRAAESAGADSGAAARALNNLGVLAEEAGDLATAEARYRETIAITPGHALARANLGDCLSAQGRWDEAAESYERAVSLAPALPLPHLGLARCRLRLGEVTAARESLEEFIRLGGSAARDRVAAEADLEALLTP